MTAPAPYDAAYYAAREGWADRRVESRAAVRALGAPAEALVLDFGCGSVPLFPTLRAAGYRPLGLETNAAAARAAAARRLGPVLRVGPGPALPLASGVAGAIIAQHLVEHLDRPEAAAREWWRVLRPGGRLVLLTPNAAHPDPAIFADPDHRALFSAGRLAALLRAAGFDQVRTRALFPYLGPGRAGRAAGRRLWRLALLPPLDRRARTLLLVARKPGR